MFRKAYLPLFLVGGAAVIAASISLAATGPIVVNSTNDTPDQTPGDGVCGSAAPTSCTLRAAIQEANALAGADEITFSVTGPITAGTDLPPITQPLTITGPAAKITISGSNANSLFKFTGLRPAPTR